MKDYLSHIGSTLISQEEIANRVKVLANQIYNDYKDKDNIVLVGVMKGAFIFFADLVRELNLDVAIEFIGLASYEANRSSGTVEVKVPYIGRNLKGANVIIVEDIVDTGITIEYLIELFKKEKPESLKICTLFSKKIRRQKDIVVDYVGFEIGDEFIIGYGLDYSGSFRNIPYIASYKEDNGLIENN